MRKVLQNVFWITSFFFFVLVPSVHAQINIVNTPGCPGTGGGGLQNPLKNICNFEDFVALLLQAVIRIGLPIAVLFIVYSGLLFVTAQGSEDKLKKAKEVFLYTIIGTAIFLGSWALALIVKNTIGILTG